MDENGCQPVQMEEDEDAYPLDNITDFNAHSKLKLLEKAVKQKVAKVKVSTLMLPSEARSSKKHGSDVKELFFFQVYEKGLTSG